MNYILVHSFNLAHQIDDPDVFAGQPLYEWEKSEVGQWVMKHSIEKPFWQRTDGFNYFGYEYRVYARFTPEDETYYRLKYT